MVKPVLLLATCFTLITIYITTTLQPACKKAFRSELFQIASSGATISIKPGIFNDNFDDIVLYTRGMDTNKNTMEDILISDERNGAIPSTITAKRGQLIANQDLYKLTLRLNDGSIHRHPRNNKETTYQTIKFTNYDINLDMGSQLNNKRSNHSRRELSWRELSDKITKTKAGPNKYEMLAEKHQRVAIAFAPFVLVLVGVPLGLQSQRSGKGAGFTMGLIVFIVYYLILNFSVTIAVEGIIPAAIAMWIPNLIFFLGGLWFLHRTAIEKPLNTELIVIS